jgi:hypothetical protein
MCAKQGRLAIKNNRTIIEPQIWMPRHVGFGRVGVDIDIYSGAF